MRWRRGVGIGAAAVLGIAIALVGAGRAGLLEGREPAGLGVRDGLLAPPSPTPNSVHSQAGRFAGHPRAGDAAIAPLPFVAGGGAATIDAIARIVAAMPGARIVERRADYLRVEFRTRWLRFVDDAEFWADPAAGAVQLRSASRVGRSDWGVNRARLDAIRARLAAGAAAFSAPAAARRA